MLVLLSVLKSDLKRKLEWRPETGKLPVEEKSCQKGPNAGWMVYFQQLWQRQRQRWRRGKEFAGELAEIPVDNASEHPIVQSCLQYCSKAGWFQGPVSAKQNRLVKCLTSSLIPGFATFAT